MYLLIVTLLLPIISGVEAGPNKNMPELQALSKYVGTWDVEVEGVNEFKAVMTAKWILNGNYLEIEDVFSSDDGKLTRRTKSLMTYNKEKKVYRHWSFDDTGATTMTEGTWNAKTQTMTTTEKIAKLHIVTAIDFSKAGIIEWHSSVTDQTGGVIRETSSVAKKRK